MNSLGCGHRKKTYGNNLNALTACRIVYLTCLIGNSNGVPSDCRQSAPRNYVSRSLFLAIAKVFCLNKHISTGFMTFVIPIPSYILQASLNSCTQK